MVTPFSIPLLERLWRDFASLAPQAERIRTLLVERGEHVHHDHVALRTIASPALGIAVLARPFEAAGFRPREEYHLAEAHLRARYWQHPDPDAPKIFISELDPDRLSAAARGVMAGLLAQLPAGFAERDDVACAGRPWLPSRADYETLAAESEHAAWIAAFGLRAHRFGLDVSALITFPDRHALAALLAEHGLRVESRDRVPVAFADGSLRLASGSYDLVDRRRGGAAAAVPRYAPVSAAK